MTNGKKVKGELKHPLIHLFVYRRPPRSALPVWAGAGWVSVLEGGGIVRFRDAFCKYLRVVFLPLGYECISRLDFEEQIRSLVPSIPQCKGEFAHSG